MTVPDDQAAPGEKAARVRTFLTNTWMDGYAEGVKHGVAVMVQSLNAVLDAKPEGLSPEALRAVLLTVQAQVGLPTEPHSHDGPTIEETEGVGG